MGPEVVRGRGDGCDGGDLWGGHPSSGEATDGDGAAAAAECLGPGSGPVATVSVTPRSPRTGPPWPEWGAAPPPSPPIPSLLSLIPTPLDLRARAELPQVSEGRGLGEAWGRGLVARGRGLRGLGLK